MKKVVRKRKLRKTDAKEWASVEDVDLHASVADINKTLNALNPQARTQDPPNLQPSWIKPLPIEEPTEKAAPKVVEIPTHCMTNSPDLKFITAQELQAGRKSEVEMMAQQYLDQLKHELVTESALNPDLLEYVWQLPEAPIDVIVIVTRSILAAGFTADWDGEITIRIGMPAMPVQGYRTRQEYTSQVKPL